MIDGHLTLARIYEAQGKAEEADAEMKETKERSIEFDATMMDDLLVAYHQARIWSMRGKPDMAMEWLCVREANVLTDQDGDVEVDHFFIELLRLATHIRLALASGRTDEAIYLLRMHQERANQHEITRSVIEGNILQALVSDTRGDNQRAMEALKEALGLAEQSGFIRLFVDEGPPLARLLYKAAAQAIHPEYVGRLLAAFPVNHTAGPPPTRRLIEPLSDREFEVLALIAEGFSNQEIANQLIISLRTVKWHSSNIYGKLAVKNRTETASRARALGILPTK
jgi:LuxR family maltose regulon positive regulatory protein